MFLNFLKNFILKRKLKNSLKNVIDIASDNKIKTIAILVDESSFDCKNELKTAIIHYGIHENDIAFITFKDKINKKEVFKTTTFCLKDIDWNTNFTNLEVQFFLNQKFDLFISYYDVEKPALMRFTQKTNANFKVGFSTIDKRLNHFMIHTNLENHKVFIDEMFKYLRILNKI